MRQAEVRTSREVIRFAPWFVVENLATSGPAKLVIGSLERWATRGGPESFEAHFAKQAPLDEVTTELREKHRGFDDQLATARKERHKELLEEVRAARLSRLTAERIYRRMTQSELAARAGMKQANISRLEHSKSVMSVSSAQRLAKALGLADYKALLP